MYVYLMYLHHLIYHPYIKGKLILSHKQTHSTIDHIKHRTIYKVTCVLLKISVN